MTLIESLEAYRVSQHVNRSQFMRTYGLKRSSYYRWLRGGTPSDMMRMWIARFCPPDLPAPTASHPEGVTP